MKFVLCVFGAMALMCFIGWAFEKMNLGLDYLSENFDFFKGL